MKQTGGWLFYLIISCIVTAGYATTLKNFPHLKEMPAVALLTSLIAAYNILLWFSPRLFAHTRGVFIYFIAQTAISFCVGLLTPGDWLVVMLYMSATGITISTLWPNVRLVTTAGLISFGLSIMHLVRSWGWAAWWQFLPTMVIVFGFVLIYVVLFTSQALSLRRVKVLLQELETTNRQLKAYAERVEALTLNQERQRMAQELHDTLVQGLAGLILQLEAIDSHLDEGHSKKAQQTAQRAMALARSTMEDARRAIQALRPALLEQNSLIGAIEREVNAFASSSGIPVSFQTDNGPLEVTADTAQDILRIIQESLNNVHRHAKADRAAVRLERDGSRVRILIEDDGIGFHPDQATQQTNAFGLRGMRERAERIGGALRVSSEPGRGTTVSLEVEMVDDSRLDR